MLLVGLILIGVFGKSGDLFHALYYKGLKIYVKIEKRMGAGVEKKSNRWFSGFWHQLHCFQIRSAQVW
jgi:hypothetical protein